MESDRGRGRGGRGKGGRGGKRGGHSENHNVKLSKAMTYILRHGAKEHGVPIADDGYVRMSDLIETSSVAKWKPKLKDILDCVENNDKKRFQIKTDPEGEEPTLENCYIRAAQGHTLEGIEEEKLLTKITFPYKYPTIVHGTYTKVMEPILEKGLCKMERNHIHLAKGYAGKKGVISGMRGSCNMFVEVNLNKIVNSDIDVYESSNGVILTAGNDGYLPPDFFKRVKGKKNEFYYMSKLDYIVVFDFECTWDKEGETKFKVQEIIEFPAVIVDCNKKEIIAQFQTYVKPSEHPKLTDFCTELTGITQDKVDEGLPIEDAVANFHKFLSTNGVLNSEFVLMSCGDFDAKAIHRESEFKKFFVPNYMKEYINIKKCFPIHLYKEDSKIDNSNIENIKKARPVVKGMTDMLEILGLELEGRHHSGIDDSINIARCVVKTLEDGYEYNQTHIASLEYSHTQEEVEVFQKRLAEIS